MVRNRVATLKPVTNSDRIERGAPLLPQPEWEAMPDTDAVWTTHEGWMHSSIAETQRKKWPAFLASIEGTRPFGWPHEAATDAAIDISAHNTIVTFGHVLGRAAVGKPRISVLDWGGGVGHYYLYARRLQPELSLDYVIKDLPRLCAVGQDLVPEATFISDDAQALTRHYDLVFASSSLQYNRDYYGVLGRLCDATAGFLMVTRSPFVEQSRDFVVVQRPYSYGYLTEYACWFVNRNRFIAFVQSRGLVLDREFMLAERPHVANAPEQCRYCGFLFRRSRQAKVFSK
jgi:putative methyltransferase (TIGR04325 family)